MKQLLTIVCFACLGHPVWADARITVLMDVLQIEEVAQILHDEGLEHSTRLEAELLDGQGGPVWAEQVRSLYDPERIESGLRHALSKGMEEDEVVAATAFFASNAGTDIVTSEIQARRIMSDAGIRIAAKELVAQTREDNPDKIDAVERFMAANDLITHNVTASMNQHYRFLKGLSDGGYNERSDADMLDEVSQMHDPITADTTQWLYSYLVLAFVPFPQGDLDAYVAFSSSNAGQALNSALFSGFEEIFDDISYGLGRAVALNARADEL